MKIQTNQLIKFAAVCLILGFVSLQSSWAGITNIGTTYRIDCSNEAPNTVLSANLPNTTGYTVNIQSCSYYITSGSGVTPSGNNYLPTSTMTFTVPSGFVGYVSGYQAGQPPSGVSIQLNFAAPPNVAPTFVGAGTSLLVAQTASATDVRSLLQVSDSNTGQTLTWTQSAAPSHGTLAISSATASSGGTSISAGGSIAYTPTAGYVGTDSFTVRVSDGTATATRTINVTVGPAPTVTIDALTLTTMTQGTAISSQTFTSSGGYGSYGYAVTAGALPNGLSLSSAGVLSGTPSAVGPFTFEVTATDSSTGTGPYSGARTFSGAVLAPVVNGVCGVVAPTAFAPTSGLCSQGNAPASASDGSPWTWSCTGSGGGTTASCSAPNASTATGSGAARTAISGGTWQVNSATSGFVATSAVSSPPTGYAFPHGLLNLNLTSGGVGSTASAVITYPNTLPPGTVYWKYGKTVSNPTPHWYQFAGATVSGNTITLSLTDGGSGDDDLSANGLISDPGGPGAPTGHGATNGIPTLSEWGMILLSSLLALLGVAQARRRKNGSW